VHTVYSNPAWHVLGITAMDSSGKIQSRRPCALLCATIRRIRLSTACGRHVA